MPARISWALTHALPGADIRPLHLNDLGRHRDRLTVARPGRTNTGLCRPGHPLNLSTAWSTERARRWPAPPTGTC